MSPPRTDQGTKEQLRPPIGSGPVGGFAVRVPGRVPAVPAFPACQLSPTHRGVTGKIRNSRNRSRNSPLLPALCRRPTGPPATSAGGWVTLTAATHPPRSGDGPRGRPAGAARGSCGGAAPHCPDSQTTAGRGRAARLMARQVARPLSGSWRCRAAAPRAGWWWGRWCRFQRLMGSRVRLLLPDSPDPYRGAATVPPGPRGQPGRSHPPGATTFGGNRTGAGRSCWSSARGVHPPFVFLSVRVRD